MESPEPGSPMEYDDDVVYPCKGCGEILEEGKAFELANNRWHIDCFRCNTCGTLLDSDANLLLLADGSLICNQCTYSCTACGNKIEDLAILTGDQAFCAGCFRCRNCKRKIENLRYARTSQGIFCMSCHESLMARRKKKQRSARQASNNAPSPMLALDKSLPAIPQDMDDDEKSGGSGGYSETPTELSPRPARPPMRTAPPPTLPAPPTIKAELSPTYPEQRQPRPYNNNRHSQIYHPSDIAELPSGDPEPYSFIPLVLDPSPPTPLPSASYRAETGNDTTTPKTERPATSRTMSNTSQTLSEPDADMSYLGRKPVNVAQAPQTQPPHIAYQQKDRQGSLPIASEMERKSLDKKPLTASTEASPYPSRTSSRTAQADISTNVTPTKSTSIERSTAEGKQAWESFKLGEVPRDRKRADTAASATILDDLSFSPMRTAGQDSGHISQKRVETSQDDSVSLLVKYSNLFSHNTTASTSSGNPTIDLSETPTPPIPRKEVPKALVSPDRDMPLDSKPERPSYDQSPPKFPKLQAPRHKPPQSDVLGSSTLGNALTDTPLLSLPLRTPVGDFSQDEDIARILGSDVSTPALLRKVSNAVRHGRSFSDLAVSVENREENAVLKSELRKSTMKIAELEMKLAMNETNSSIDPTKIEEQRTQLAGLESERESRIRELEVWLIGKDGKDFDTFKKDSIRNLAKELENLRNTYEAQVQELSIQRGTLVEEISRLTRIRDQTIQDTEQLNMKNTQLMDLNNEITRQIQGKFQSNKLSFPAPNGLGIMNKEGNDLLDSQKAGVQSSAASTAGTHNHMNDGGEDDDVIIAQPTIVNVGRKGGYIKKSWKKGGAAIIKGAGKGFNKVFATEQHGHGQQQGLQGSQYESTSNLLPPSTDALHGPQRSQTVPDPHGGFDKIFGTPKFRMNKKIGTGTSGTNGNGSFSAINSSGLLASKEEGTVVLFGSELEARAHYEGKSIPYVVSRCIQEVEARGMDFEGIYRKSGGASSMRQIQEAFERGEELDIGDSVDICGVTSVLKQYFRRLPTPIITPAIYDEFLKTTKILDVEKRIQEIKNIMSQLSMVHQDVLGYVIFHLRKVAEKESKNLMTTRNLAVVFAPTLMWHIDSDREMQDMHEKNNAIQFLIENGEAIFFS